MLISYNQIFFPVPNVTELSFNPVRDESGTDTLATELTLACEFVVNTNYLSLIAPDIAAMNPRNAADIANLIGYRLRQPRKQLSIKCNGVELVPDTGQGIDADNGPKPGRVPCVLMTNTTFIVQFTCTARYVETLENLAPGKLPQTTAVRFKNPLLASRWTETVDLDNCNFSTRTREGWYAIRSDNLQNQTADQYRARMCTLGVPQGFLRQSSSYRLDPSGLRMGFRVTDKEQFKMPPNPAFEADGYYSETLTNGGAKRVGECVVRLKGDARTDQSALLDTAIKVAAAKLRVTGAILPKKGNAFGILGTGVIKVPLYRNEVEVQLVTMMKPATSPDGTGRKESTWGFDLNALTFTPGTDGQPPYTPGYPIRGTANLLLQAAAYWDPTLQQIGLDPATGQLTGTNQGGNNQPLLVPGKPTGGQ